MKTLIIKLKYYIYGGIFGIVLISIYQAIRLVTASINVHEPLSWAVIGITALFLIFLLRFLWLKQSTWKKWKDCRYFQKKNYDVLFLAGGICPFVFFAAGFFSNMNQDNTFIKCIVFTILLGSTAYLATVKKKIPYSMKKANIKKKKLSPDREIVNFRDDAFFEKQEQEFVKDFDKYTGACVFGIEGPWGVGKTSFASLCCKRLKGIHKDNIVIYKFNPLNYEDTNKVLKNFCSGLIAKIQEKHFEPELEALLTSYMDKIIAVVSNPSFFNIQFKFPDTPCSEDVIVKKLEAELEKISYQIVVVIDDLDRLDFLTIKKIFFLMRNIFCFDKLKFIVCYDLENVIWSAEVNLNSDSTDEEKIIEFVDKYINETYHLYFKTDKIRDYIQDLAAKYMKLQSVKSVLWDSSIDAILNICVGKDFFYYQKFFGTPRRIKKILQQLVRVSKAVGDVDTTYDFAGIDLVNLLLIYLYYPTDFKKIYYAETGGRRGTYTFDKEINDKNKRDIKIKSVENIIKELPLYERFLLTKLFIDKRFLNEFRRNNIYRRACFNIPSFFSPNGTLEKYLRLIVFSESPKKNELYGMYKEIIKCEVLPSESTEVIRNIFKKYRDIQIHLWEAIADDVGRCFDEKISITLLKNLILIAIEQLDNYRITSELSGLRTKMIYYIRTLLNSLADTQMSQAVDFIFADNGVLKYLLERKNNNEMLFHIFDALYLKGIIDVRTAGKSPLNLANALVYDIIPEAPIGSFETDEMAVIELGRFSGYIYEVFIGFFYDKDLWHEFERLPLEKFFEFNSDQERKICLFKFKIFIFNEIGNRHKIMAKYRINKNKNWIYIQDDFCNYLVEQCFNFDKLGKVAGFNFVEFVLISCFSYDKQLALNFVEHLRGDSKSQFFSAEALTSILPPNILKKIWQTNRNKILDNNIFFEKFFHINPNTIIEAQCILDVIVRSLDYWTSDDQSKYWDSLL